MLFSLVNLSSFILELWNVAHPSKNGAMCLSLWSLHFEI